MDYHPLMELLLIKSKFRAFESRGFKCFRVDFLQFFNYLSSTPATTFCGNQIEKDKNGLVLATLLKLIEITFYRIKRYCIDSFDFQDCVHILLHGGALVGGFGRHNHNRTCGRKTT